MRELLARGAQRHPIVVYTVARLCIFVAVALPLRVIGLTGLMWLAMALMISGMISLFAARRGAFRSSGAVSPASSSGSTGASTTRPARRMRIP